MKINRYGDVENGICEHIRMKRDDFLRKIFEKFSFDDNLFHLVSKGFKKIKSKKTITNCEDIIQ